MTAKILINSDVLQKMFADQPEVELELVRNGAAQVAERLRQRIMSTTGEDIIKTIVDRINGELNYKYHMPPAVMKVISTIVTEQIQKHNAETAEVMAKKYFDEALTRHSKALETKINDIATGLIEKKVAAVFAAAARLK